MARLFIFTKPDSINRPGTKDNLHIVPLKYKRKILGKKRKHDFEKKNLAKKKKERRRSRPRKKKENKILPRKKESKQDHDQEKKSKF